MLLQGATKMSHYETVTCQKQFSDACFLLLLSTRLYYTYKIHIVLLTYSEMAKYTKNDHSSCQPSCRTADKITPLNAEFFIEKLHIFV